MSVPTYASCIVFGKVDVRRLLLADQVTWLNGLVEALEQDRVDWSVLVDDSVQFEEVLFAAFRGSCSWRGDQLLADTQDDTTELTDPALLAVAVFLLLLILRHLNTAGATNASIIDHTVECPVVVVLFEPFCGLHKEVRIGFDSLLLD